MAAHLSEETLIDVLEGEATRPVREHVLECAECERRLASLRAGLELASGADVPEPSPLYWEAFGRQLSAHLDGGEQRGWRFGWRPLLATAAVLVAALSFVPGLGRKPPAALEQPAWTALPPASEDAGLELLESAFLEQAEQPPLAECRGIAGCVVNLSDAESAALAAAMRAQLGERVS